MKEFDYDINKYMSYRKTSRDEAENDKKYFIMEIKRQDKEMASLQNENKTLKQENRQLKAENEIMRNIINSYENECKLSDGAKRFVHDIEKGVI